MGKPTRHARPRRPERRAAAVEGRRRARGLARFQGSRETGERAIAILGPHFEATGGDRGIVGAVRARFRPDAARGIREAYEWRVGDRVFHARVDDGEVEMNTGPAPDAAVSLTTDLPTLLALGAHTTTIEAAIAAGTLEVFGDPRRGCVWPRRSAPPWVTKRQTPRRARRATR